MEIKKSSRRGHSTAEEQISRSETIDLRNKLIGRSCQLFFKSDPIKIVHAKGMSGF